MTMVLETSHLCKSFGGISATRDVCFGLKRGARHALIGPNGSGKTTLVNLLTGTLSPTSGAIRLNGMDITRHKPNQRVRLGLARTFQINQLFASLTPLQALTLAVSEQHSLGQYPWKSLSRYPQLSRGVSEIEFQFGLGDVLTKPISTLAYGQQRLLEIALAFACRPSVLLLDEPAAGVPESERDAILRAISRLPLDVAVLLIEHDMDLVYRFAERISVLAGGRILVEGTPDEIANDARVKTVYLGEEDHD